MTSFLFFRRLVKALIYVAAVSLTLSFSRDSSRLEREMTLATVAFTFLLSFFWATVTFSQTACWEFSLLAASLSSLVEAEFSELAKEAFTSFPRLLHRPDSTQNAAIGILPDLGGTMKSVEIIRSWSPPRTISPDCT